MNLVKVKVLIEDLQRSWWCWGLILTVHLTCFCWGCCFVHWVRTLLSNSLGQKEGFPLGHIQRFWLDLTTTHPKVLEKSLWIVKFLRRGASLPPCWGRTHNATGHLCYLGTVPLLSLTLIQGEVDYRKTVGRDERMRGGEEFAREANAAYVSFFWKKKSLFYRPCQIHWSTSQHLRGVRGASELIFPPLYLVGREGWGWIIMKVEGRNAEVELNNLVLKKTFFLDGDVIKHCKP